MGFRKSPIILIITTKSMLFSYLTFKYIVFRDDELVWNIDKFLMITTLGAFWVVFCSIFFFNLVSYLEEAGSRGADGVFRKVKFAFCVVSIFLLLLIAILQYGIDGNMFTDFLCAVMGLLIIGLLGAILAIRSFDPTRQG